MRICAQFGRHAIWFPAHTARDCRRVYSYLRSWAGKQAEGGFMKTISMLLIAAMILGAFGSAFGQTVEMAAKCDEAYQKLSELVNQPDMKEAKLIKQSLGVDILDACDGPKGKMTCFQCIDKNGLLRTLQILQTGAGEKFQFLGYGCECRDSK